MTAAGKGVSPPYLPPGLAGESSLNRASFWGPRIPPQVEAMAKSLQELEKEIFRKLLKATVGALEGKECQALVKTVAESARLSEEQLAVLLAGMYGLLREALRLPLSSLKQEVFKEDLKLLRIPEEFIADFAKVVFGNRQHCPLLFLTDAPSSKPLFRNKETGFPESKTSSGEWMLPFQPALLPGLYSLPS
ncbi:COMM domain-containing protein 5-like isoform X2 [Notechis scutatus]|uniref:COMM domain-containing protein 5-like isoform X2 n=1 Tax=Notechis scutatus TaxID=8663 RepID=A0A6J1VKP3_9SAUR|nr:COMM domain-containing protein 5-like isoform X2 [Notechis scutatus]